MYICCAQRGGCGLATNNLPSSQPIQTTGGPAGARDCAHTDQSINRPAAALQTQHLKQQTRGYLIFCIHKKIKILSSQYLKRLRSVVACRG